MGLLTAQIKLLRTSFEEKGVPGHYYQCEEGWVGFGWNRDHLLQTCLNHDHGCDWILKMDCDEYLEVDDDFDWSLIDDTNIQVISCYCRKSWMHLLSCLDVERTSSMALSSMMSPMNVLFVILRELVKIFSVSIFPEVSVKWELGMEKAMLHLPNTSVTH